MDRREFLAGTSAAALAPALPALPGAAQTALAPLPDPSSVLVSFEPDAIGLWRVCSVNGRVIGADDFPVREGRFIIYRDGSAWAEPQGRDSAETWTASVLPPE